MIVSTLAAAKALLGKKVRYRLIGGQDYGRYIVGIITNVFVDSDRHPTYCYYFDLEREDTLTKVYSVHPYCFELAEAPQSHQVYIDF